MAGGLKVEGANQLRTLAVELKAADKTLWRATRRNMAAATLPIRRAVQENERSVLPKTGGLNEWVASTPIRHSTLTGVRSAGVRIQQSKKGRIRPHDLRRMNDEGVIRHPVFADPAKSRKQWKWVEQTGLPTGWWEGPILARREDVTAACLQAMHEAARVAGFRGP